MSHHSEVGGSTEPETLDDIFDAFQEEIAISTGLKEKEAVEEEEVEGHIKGVLPGDFNVYETYDTSTVPMQTLPIGIADEYKDLAEIASEREKEASRNFVLPGCDRHMMPDVPQKSQRLRDFENPQSYPFSTLPIEDAERMLQLRAIQKLMKDNNVFENQQGKDKQARNKVFERKYDEFLE